MFDRTLSIDSFESRQPSILVPPAERWNEDTTPFRDELYLDATTYSVEPLFDPPMPAPRLTPNYVVSPEGTFAYLNTVLPAWEPLTLFGAKQGAVIWNGDVVIPMLVDMKRRDDGDWFDDTVPERERAAWGPVWMSLTPAEMISQRSGVRKAKGKVVIGGLGMGWFLRKVCEKEEVEEVIVVEKSHDLLDWYGYHLCQRQPKVKDVICNDVYGDITRHGDAQFLLDIWPIYEGARQDNRLRKIRKILGDRLWAWGMD
jgi:hypothetical protein